MTLLNKVLETVFDLALAPFATLPTWVGLLVVSLVAAIFMLIVFKHTSNQERLEVVKRKIHAGIFEIRLFNDDMRAIFRAQWEILRHNLSYLRLSIVPMIWILPPLALGIAQLQFHYGYETPALGVPLLLEVEMGDDVVDAPALELRTPDGVRVDTPGLWSKSRHEMTWRVVPEKTGEFELEIGVPGGETVKKVLAVPERITQISPVRQEPGFWNQLLYPVEDPIPTETGIREIRLQIRDGEVPFLGISLHWMIWFFALSIVFAFALRKPLGVTI